jgi:hypothetical protein
MMAVFVFWLLLAFVVAIAANSRGRSGAGWFVLSVILSPLIGLILVLVLPNLRHERLTAEAAESRDRNGSARSTPFELDGVYAEVPYRVLGDDSVEALMQGGVVRFRSADHLFRALGRGSPIETAPIQEPPPIPEQPVLKAPTSKAHFQILAVGGVLVVGIIGLYAFQVADDRSRPVSESRENTASNAARPTESALSTEPATATKMIQAVPEQGTTDQSSNKARHEQISRKATESKRASAADPSGEKCDKRGMKIFSGGRAAASSQDTCCGGKSPRVGMTLREVESTCWPKPHDERRYTSAAGTTVVRTYSVETNNGRRKDLTYVNDVLTSIYEGL